MIKELLTMKLVTFSRSLYSSKFKRHFDTQYPTAKVKSHPAKRGKLRLMIDEVSDSNWFRNKHKEFLQIVRIKPRQRQVDNNGKREKIVF